MKEKFPLNLSQHAYIIFSASGSAILELKDSIEKLLGGKLDGSPDFHHEKYDSFGIDEARALKGGAANKPVSEWQVFLIEAKSITRETQNALLKVFEEPNPGTYIFLVLPHVRDVLPTLRSRVRVINQGELGEKYEKETKSLLSQERSTRLNEPFVKKLIEDKDKESVLELFNSIEKIFSERRDLVGSADFLKEFFRAKKYLGDQSSSAKMLLEHILLLAPKI